MVLLKIFLVANVFAFTLSSPNLWRNLGNSHVGGRIIGGFVTTIETNPWQVSLQYGGHYCGGSVIGERWVISAAHCSAYVNSSQVLKLNFFFVEIIFFWLFLS